MRTTIQHYTCGGQPNGQFLTELERSAFAVHTPNVSTLRVPSCPIEVSDLMVTFCETCVLKISIADQLNHAFQAKRITVIGLGRGVLCRSQYLHTDNLAGLCGINQSVKFL